MSLGKFGVLLPCRCGGSGNAYYALLSSPSAKWGCFFAANWKNVTRYFGDSVWTFPSCVMHSPILAQPRLLLIPIVLQILTPLVRGFIVLLFFLLLTLSNLRLCLQTAHSHFNLTSVFRNFSDDSFMTFISEYLRNAFGSGIFSSIVSAEIENCFSPDHFISFLSAFLASRSLIVSLMGYPVPFITRRGVDMSGPSSYCTLSRCLWRVG